MKIFNFLKSHFLLTIFIAVCFVIFFICNDKLFKVSEHTAYANWIFLPAGLRLSFVLIYRWRAILGLFCGSMLASFYAGHFEHMSLLVLTALASSLNALIALKIAESSEKKYFTNELEHLNFKAIFYMAVLQATIAVIFHHTFYFIYHIENTTHILHLYTMFFGDLMGILFMGFLTVLVFKLILKRYPKRQKDL